jgi:hypothetical protein
MKTRLLVLSLALTLTAGSRVGAEEAKPTPAAKPATAKPEKPDTELEKTMSKMNKAWRQVRKAAHDGKLSPATADLIATVRTGAKAATKLTPAMEADKPAAERLKFHADYEAQMKKVIEKLTVLETTLKANDTATAAKLVSEVTDLMKAGHKDFRKPEEK